MSPQALFGLQFTLSLVVFSLVARWYIAPALARLSVEAALVPLFLVHALRYLPASGFAPGQIDPDIPAAVFAHIAYGDLACALLALVAAIVLRYRWPLAVPIAYLANGLMSLDWLYATFLAASNELVTYDMGGNWYIVAFYVPVLGVVHVMIFARLAKARAERERPPRS
jgi:hypothetical protein